MSKTNAKTPSQSSILSFVDSPEQGKGLARPARTRSLKRPSAEPSFRPRDSSGSTSQKRKLSGNKNISGESNRKPIMDESQTPETPEEPVPDSFAKALKAMEDRLEECITASMKSMLIPIQNSITNLVKSKEAWEIHKAEVDTLKNTQKALKKQIDNYETVTNALLKCVKTLEDKLMESNIIMHVIKESAWEPENTHRELVLKAITESINADDPEEKMNIARKISIKSINRVGRYSAMWSHPICISFACKSDADILLECKKSLKKGVYIDKEYSYEDEGIRKKLRPILKAAHGIDMYRGKCKMEGTTLVIKGKKYTLSNLHDLPVKLSGFHVSSKSSDDVMGFFGKLNPFSNFHPTVFTYEGHTYHSSEQFIQYAKCMFFKDAASAEKVLNSKTPLESEHTSKDIKNFDMEIWKTHAKKVCSGGIKAKFDQHHALQHLLQSSGTKTLVKCCKDSLWGTGIPLSASECLDKNKWYNQGILGVILEEI